MPCHRRLLHSQCRSHAGGFIASAPPSVKITIAIYVLSVEDVNAPLKVYTAPISVPGSAEPGDGRQALPNAAHSTARPSCVAHATWLVHRDVGDLATGITTST